MEDELGELTEDQKNKIRAMRSCGDGDLHKLIFLSGVSKKQFVEDIFDRERYPEEIVGSVIYLIAESPVIPQKTREGLFSWLVLSDDDRRKVMGEAYDAMMQLPSYNSSEDS